MGVRTAAPSKIEVAIVHRSQTRRRQLMLSVTEERGLEIVAGAGGVLEILDASKSPRSTDVLLIDADQPANLDVHTWALFRSAMPLTRVVALISDVAPEIIESLLAFGVMAALSDEATPHAITNAIRNAAGGILDYEAHLIAKVKDALMYPRDSGSIAVGDLVVETSQGVVVRNGERIVLTPLEAAFVHVLANNLGRVVQYEDLYRKVWNVAEGGTGSPDQVWSCVKRLRSKIEADPSDPRFIHSVRGVGYVLRDRENDRNIRSW